MPKTSYHYPRSVPRVNVPMRNEIYVSVNIYSDIFRLFRIVQVEVAGCETIMSIEYWIVDVDFVGIFWIKTDRSR